MTNIIIDEKSKKGKIVLELIKELGIGKIVGNEKIKTVKPNQITLESIRLIKQIRTGTHSDLF